MKKQEINLTKDEKIEFLAKYQLSDDKKILKTSKTVSALRQINLILSAALLTLGLISFDAYFITLSLGLGSIDVLYIMKSIKDKNKVISNISDGKLTYKQFKQIEKSGELASWQEKYKTEIIDKIEEILDLKPEQYVAEKINEQNSITNLEQTNTNYKTKNNNKNQDNELQK